MRITIVGGFFLPVPPIHGGAMEKMWWRLSRHYVRRGHQVTLISRQTSNSLCNEIVDGVRMLRVRGFDHRRHLWQNLLLDACWGWRVLSRLPEADILITNTVGLPVFVRSLRPRAGLLIVNLNRYPKGQIRWYGRAARIQAASPAIAEAATAQAPRLSGIIRHVPNPVDCSLFAGPAPIRDSNEPITVGFMGRIHPEKGLLTLVEAASRLARQTDLPAWRIILRGPTEIAKGGGGINFVDRLQGIAPELWHNGRVILAPALNDPVELARAYRSLDIFCYPTEAATGEAHPVAVLEAMAAGLPIVTTDLPCFAGQLRPDENALLVPPADAGALAVALGRLLRDRTLAGALGNRARESVWTLDDEVVADQHLADFENLLHAHSSG